MNIINAHLVYDEGECKLSLPMPPHRLSANLEEAGIFMLDSTEGDIVFVDSPLRCLREICKGNPRDLLALNRIAENLQDFTLRELDDYSRVLDMIGGNLTQADRLSCHYHRLRRVSNVEDAYALAYREHGLGDLPEHLRWTSDRIWEAGREIMQRERGFFLAPREYVGLPPDFHQLPQGTDQSLWQPLPSLEPVVCALYREGRDGATHTVTLPVAAGAGDVSRALALLGTDSLFDPSLRVTCHSAFYPKALDIRTGDGGLLFFHMQKLIRGLEDQGFVQALEEEAAGIASWRDGNAAHFEELRAATDRVIAAEPAWSRQCTVFPTGRPLEMVAVSRELPHRSVRLTLPATDEELRQTAEALCLEAWEPGAFQIRSHALGEYTALCAAFGPQPDMARLNLAAHQLASLDSMERIRFLAQAAQTRMEPGEILSETARLCGQRYSEACVPALTEELRQARRAQDMELGEPMGP